MTEPTSGSGTVCSPKACCLFTRPWGSVADMTPSVAPAVAHLSDPHLTTGALGAEPARGLHRALGRVLDETSRNGATSLLIKFQRGVEGILHVREGLMERIALGDEPGQVGRGHGEAAFRLRCQH